MQTNARYVRVYLNPPHFGNESDYGQGMFDRTEFELMAQLLRRIRGQFILSFNDHGS